MKHEALRSIRKNTVIAKVYQPSKILGQSLLVKLAEKFKINHNQQFYNGNQKICLVQVLKEDTLLWALLIKTSRQRKQLGEGVGWCGGGG